MPSTATAGCAPEVRLRERDVDELVRDDPAALVRAAVAVGAPEHEHALTPDRSIALAEPWSRTALSATATSDLSVLRSLVSAFVSLPLRATITSTRFGGLDARQAALHPARPFSRSVIRLPTFRLLGASARKCLLVRAL